MARTRSAPISKEDRLEVGRSLRGLRRASGFRSVETAASAKGCPAARQTIYAYERGGLTPSLAQFLDLVEFYVLGVGGDSEEAKATDDLCNAGVAAVTRALGLSAYHVSDALGLIARMQSREPSRRRRGAT
jgi:hypothetical protein